MDKSKKAESSENKKRAVVKKGKIIVTKQGDLVIKLSEKILKKD